MALPCPLEYISVPQNLNFTLKKHLHQYNYAKNSLKIVNCITVIFQPIKLFVRLIAVKPEAMLIHFH